MRSVEKRLRTQIANLEQEVANLEADRNLFREHFAYRFRWWIKLVGEKSSPNLPYLIEDDAKWLFKFTWWHW